MAQIHPQSLLALPFFYRRIIHFPDRADLIGSRRQTDCIVFFVDALHLPVDDQIQDLVQGIQTGPRLFDYMGVPGHFTLSDYQSSLLSRH